MIPRFECAVCGYFTLGSAAGADCKGQNLKAVTVVPACVCDPKAHGLTMAVGRGTGFMEYDRMGYSGLMLAARITLPHFSVSSAMSLPKSAGEPASVLPPDSAIRALILESARAALVSWLSLSMISAGVPLGAPRPNQTLAS